MIPASYLFKTLYHDQWEKPEPMPPQAQYREPRGGRKIPLLAMLSIVAAGAFASRSIAVNSRQRGALGKTQA